MKSSFVMMALAGVMVIGTQTTAWSASAPKSETTKLSVGDQVPNFGAPDVEGKAFTVKRLISDLATDSGCGALVFFTTVCVPCKRELMQMKAAADRLQAAGVQVVLVAAGESARKVRPFLHRSGIPFRTVTDSYMEISRLFGLTTPQMTVNVPRTFLFGQDGKICGVLKESGTDVVDQVIATCRQAPAPGAAAD